MAEPRWKKVQLRTQLLPRGHTLFAALFRTADVPSLDCKASSSSFHLLSFSDSFAMMNRILGLPILGAGHSPRCSFVAAARQPV